MKNQFIFFLLLGLDLYLFRAINATNDTEIVDGITIGGEEYIKLRKLQKLTQATTLKTIQDEIEGSAKYYQYLLMLFYKYDPFKKFQLTKSYYRMFLEEIYVLPIQTKYTKLQIASMQTVLDDFVKTKNETIDYTEIKEDIIDLGFITFFDNIMKQEQQKQQQQQFFMDEMKKFTQKELQKNSTNYANETSTNQTGFNFKSFQVIKKENLNETIMNETEIENEQEMNDSENISQAENDSSL